MNLGFGYQPAYSVIEDLISAIRARLRHPQKTEQEWNSLFFHNRTTAPGVPRAASSFLTGQGVTHGGYIGRDNLLVCLVLPRSQWAGQILFSIVAPRISSLIDAIIPTAF
jgi:hypothetical protein